MTLPIDSEERLEAAITRVADAVRDGFDVADIAIIVREGVEIAESFGDLTSTEKKALALAFGERLIDEFFDTATPAIEKMVVELDLPGPEWFERTVWDPALTLIAPKLLKPALKSALPALVDLVISAHNGALQLKTNAPTASEE